MYRVIVGEAGGDTENALLNETVPNWVTSNLEENCTGKFMKVQFYLQPHSSVPSNLLKQDRLKKVMYSLNAIVRTLVIIIFLCSLID